MRKLIKNKDGYIKVVGMLVGLLIALGIGALIFWETTDSFEGSSTAANDSIDAVEDQAATVFDLAPLIGLVVVASILLGVIIKFGK